MSALGTRTRLGYSLGSFVTGAFGTVPGLLLLPYLTDTLAVPAAAAGAIVLLPKAWDVVFNPVAGRLSDADLVRRGSRVRSLVVGGLALAVTFAALFAYPGFGSVGADSAYVVAVFFLCATAFAFFQVPFNALPAELTDGYHERTRLTTWRIAVLALAILTSGAVAPAIVNGIGGVAGRAMGCSWPSWWDRAVLSVRWIDAPTHPTGGNCWPRCAGGGRPLLGVQALVHPVASVTSPATSWATLTCNRCCSPGSSDRPCW